MLTMYLAMLSTEEDRERFAVLYEAYEKRLYAVALKILANPSQAEDAAQQAWLQVLRNWERVRELEWRARQIPGGGSQKRGAGPFEKGAVDGRPCRRNGILRAPESGEDEYRRLVALILSLPEAYRRVLELKYVMEESNQAIARRLGMKESTVSTRVQRGRKLLLEAMEREGYCYG